MTRKVLAVFILLVSSAYAQLNVNQLSGFGAGGDVDPETMIWRGRVIANGGTFATDSVSIANTLIKQLKSKSYSSKIVYLLPLLGSNLAAARVPLRDSVGVGIALNTNFVDADFSQSTGLKGNGSSKYLDLNIKPSQLGSGSNGGIGYWETSIDFTGTGTEPIGVNPSNTPDTRFLLDLRSTRKFFAWGTTGDLANVNTAAANGHYYGQRSSATSRELFFAGSSIATNTTSDSATNVGLRTITLMASFDATSFSYWKGRCAVAYLTDGTLSSSDVSDFNTLLQTYLMTPTGR